MDERIGPSAQCSSDKGSLSHLSEGGAPEQQHAHDAAASRRGGLEPDVNTDAGTSSRRNSRYDRRRRRRAQSRRYRRDMKEAVEGQVAVPDLIGLAVPHATDVGHGAAVVVVAAEVDGPPLGSLTWPGDWIVTEQAPVAGSRVPKWANVRVTFRRADGNEAGDREPRLPSPNPGHLEAHATLDDEQVPLPDSGPADGTRRRDEEP